MLDHHHLELIRQSLIGSVKASFGLHASNTKSSSGSSDVAVSQQKQHLKQDNWNSADSDLVHFAKMMRSAGPRRTSLPFVGERLLNEFGSSRRRPLWDLREEGSAPTNKNSIKPNNLSPTNSLGGGGGGVGQPTSFFSKNLWPSFRRQASAKPQLSTPRGSPPDTPTATQLPPLPSTTSAQPAASVQPQVGSIPPVSNSSIIYIQMPSRCDHVSIPTENGPMVLQLVLPPQHSSTGLQYQSGGASALKQAAIASTASSSSSSSTDTPAIITDAYTDSLRAVNCSVPINSTALVSKQDGQKLSTTVGLSVDHADGRSTVRVVPLPPLPTSEEEKSIIFKKQLSTLLSCIYAIFFVMLGGVIYVSDVLLPSKPYAEMFTIYLTVVGLTWLSFLQFDIRLYLTSLSKWRKQEKRKSCAKDNDGYQKSSGDEDVKHVVVTAVVDNDTGVLKAPPDAYCFKTGPHSGSFYLKIGAAGFCFGHLIHEGLLLSRQILYFTSGEVYREQCADIVGTIHQVLHPIFSFYQLFIIFKYSNIVINRYRELAKVGLMHIIAANLCLWLNTIIRETVDSLNHNLQELERSNYSTDSSGNEQWLMTTVAEDGVLNRTHLIHNTLPSYSEGYYKTLKTASADLCLSKTILSAFTIQASPYLYPFTIEYSLLQVGIWFVIWYNIGNLDGVQTESEKTRAALEANATNCAAASAACNNGTAMMSSSGASPCANDDDDELCLGESGHFSSNLVIHVDCHSANRGLFAGLFVLLATVVSVIIFFVAMTNRQYTKTGIIINNVSDAVLLVIMTLSVLFAYRQTAKLDINTHANPFLDDFLLFIALPCFFLYAIFNIVAGIALNSPFNVVISILSVIQVVCQTPFIIDGLRRCSNSYLLRYKKPGRELITFLVVCNIASWILETFEIKSHETHSDKAQFYGSFLWTLLSHITLPLTLFYRFHSSVCLVDMWKSAYEPGDVH